MAYDVGDLVRIGNHTASSAQAFKNLAGADTDPTAVTLRVGKPDGTQVTYTYGGSPALSREATGRYYADVSVDQPGMWSYRLAGTGAVQAAAEGQLHVLLSAF